MKIFKDLLDDNQEFFSDGIKYEEVDEIWLKYTAKLINKPSDDMSSINIGANASAEGEDAEELCDGQSSTEKVLDVCFYHKLVQDPTELFKDKKWKMKYFKNYMAQIKKKIAEEEGAEKAEEVNAHLSKHQKDILKVIGNKDADVFVGENWEPPADEAISQGMVFGVWNDDGMSVDFFVLKAGVREEKV